jgi:ferritin
VSKQIDALYELAFNEKMFAAMAELQWFVTEQVEEEKTMREIVAKIKMVGHDPSSLLDLDRELGSRQPERRRPRRGRGVVHSPASRVHRPLPNDRRWTIDDGRSRI